jgi:hypothetical protein
MYVVRELTDQPGKLDCFSIDWNDQWGVPMPSPVVGSDDPPHTGGHG